MTEKAAASKKDESKTKVNSRVPGFHNSLAQNESDATCHGNAAVCCLDRLSSARARTRAAQ